MDRRRASIASQSPAEESAAWPSPDPPVQPAAGAAAVPAEEVLFAAPVVGGCAAAAAIGAELPPPGAEGGLAGRDGIPPAAPRKPVFVALEALGPAAVTARTEYDATTPGAMVESLKEDVARPVTSAATVQAPSGSLRCTR